jgi:ATP-binding cassette, subfamily B (MDR/TAP), member 1
VFYEPPHQLVKDSRFWASMYVVLASVAFLAIPTEYFFFGWAGGKLIERIRSMTFESVVYQEINWFDEPKNSRFIFLFLPLCVRICVYFSYKPVYI